MFKTFKKSFLERQLETNRNLWADREKSIAYIEEDYDFRASLRGMESGEKRRAFFQLPTNPSVEDYYERILSFPSLGEILVGIRFRSLDTNFPFVQVTANFSPEKFLENLSIIQEKIQAEFSIFTPKGFTFVVPESLVSSKSLGVSSHFSGVETWNLYVVGPPSQRVVPEIYRLEKTEEMINYSFFEKEYQHWNKMAPELAIWVSPASKEEFQQGIDQGLYFHFYIKDQLAGVIMGLEEMYYDQIGAYVCEELIFPNFQKQGHASWMQTLFHQAIQHRYPIIWGTIHSDNLASLKTATRCGRKITERELFFPF